MKKTIKILICIFMFITNIVPLKAATATISVSSSTNTIVIGNTFTVTVKISSSVVLGSWEWVINYDTNKFKLTSGESYIVDYGDGKIKSKSYIYKFKAIGTGTGTIGVKSVGAYDYSENNFSISSGSKKVKVITQAELEASYSKNNNLSSLSVEGLQLSPSFNKNTLEYICEAQSNTEKITINANKEDKYASINGTGSFEVAEGENKFDIIVTAQNGTTKTYTIIVNIIDNNPIEININNEKYTVIKKASLLESKENFVPKEITINEIQIPALYNELNDYTLVGLRDSKSNIKLFIYENNTYTPYEEITLDQLKIMPLKIEKEFDNNYKKEMINIGEYKYEALKVKNSSLSIIHARNLNTGKEDYYIYDETNNTITTYSEEVINIYKNINSKYLKIIYLLIIETIIIFIILLGILIKKVSKKKNKKQKIIKKDKDNNVKDIEIKDTKKKEVKNKNEKKKNN